MAGRIMKYNPAFLSENELVESFAVREVEYELLMRAVRENHTGINQHILVVGPRGAGKTMLLLRAIAGVRRDPLLSSQWYPIVYGEESYQVFSAGEFWLEAFIHLHHQTKDAQWQAVYQELKRETDEHRLHDRALGKLLDFADHRKQRLLLVVENLNMILSNQMNDAEAWALRHTLINEPRIMLLASATGLGDEFRKPKKAFYDQLRPLSLHPLNTGACQKLWKTITSHDLDEQHIRPMEILTGGSPRLIAILATFAGEMSLRHFLEDLTHLLDDHTGYFKSHLENLPPNELKTYLALLERWDPSTARLVAEDARMKVSTASMFLQRLVDRGYVTEHSRKGRRVWYQTAERLYNVYYLMRRRGGAAQRIHAAAWFILVFYSPEELIDVTKQIANEALGLESDFTREHAAVCIELLSHMPYQFQAAAIRSLPDEFFSLPEVPESIREQISYFANKKDVADDIIKLAEGCLDLFKAGNLTAMRQQAEQMVKEFPEKAISWFYLGLSQEDEHPQEAEDAYQKSLDIDPKYSMAWSSLGQLLHEKLRRYDDAEAAYRKALEIDPKSGFAWAQLGQLLHENLQRYDEAEAAYHKALDINPKSGFAWAQLGHLLHKNLQRYDEAEAAYHKTLDIDPKYAWAWAQLGQLLHENLQRYEEAETAYRKAIELSSNWGFPRYRLFKMLLHSLGNVPKAIELAETSKLEINNNSSLAVALHSFAWSSFQSEHWEILPWAEKWAERAYASDGKNMVFRHTLAAITLVRGKLESLLELAKPLYYDEKFLPDYLGDAIQLLIDLAALGKEREAWDLLRGSPAEAKMEPMAVALRTLLGEDLKVAVEIFEIAKDVVKRIETRKSQIAARLEAAKEKESFEYPVTEPIVVH